jgi:adenylate kinase
MVKKYGFKHLSSGDLLRAEVESGSKLGHELNETMREGKLVPLVRKSLTNRFWILRRRTCPFVSHSKEVTLSLIKGAILAHCSAYNGFLIDGYPRDVVQGKRFESEVFFF